MRAVWKFTLDASVSNVPMPAGAKVVHVAKQRTDDDWEAVTVWAEVDTAAPLERRHLTIYGTGHQIPETSTHVGTWIEGPYVWHLYEDRL